jgi:hypothetical protein
MQLTIKQRKSKLRKYLVNVTNISVYLQEDAANFNAINFNAIDFNITNFNVNNFNTTNFNIINFNAINFNSCLQANTTNFSVYLQEEL